MGHVYIVYIYVRRNTVSISGTEEVGEAAQRRRYLRIVHYSNINVKAECES